MVRATLAASLALVVCFVLTGFRVDRVQAQWVDPCSGYGSYAAALTIFVALGGPVNDPGLMDGDGDGFPCEHFADAPSAAGPALGGVYPRGGNAGGGPALPDPSPASSGGGATDPPSASIAPDATDSGGESGPAAGRDLTTLPGELAPDAISIYAWVAGDDENAGTFAYDAEAPEPGRFAVEGELTIATVDVFTGIVIDAGTTDSAGLTTLDAIYGVPFSVVAHGDPTGSPPYVLDTGMSLAVHVTAFVSADGSSVGGVVGRPSAPGNPGVEGNPVPGPVEGPLDESVGYPVVARGRTGAALPDAGLIAGQTTGTADIREEVGASSRVVLALPVVGSGPVAETGLAGSTMVLAILALATAILAVRLGLPGRAGRVTVRIRAP